MAVHGGDAGRPHGPIPSSDAVVKDDFIHLLFISLCILAHTLWPFWENVFGTLRCTIVHHLPSGAPVAVIVILG